MDFPPLSFLIQLNFRSRRNTMGSLEMRYDKNHDKCHQSARNHCTEPIRRMEPVDPVGSNGSHADFVPQ